MTHLLTLSREHCPSWMELVTGICVVVLWHIVCASLKNGIFGTVLSIVHFLSGPSYYSLAGAMKCDILNLGTDSLKGKTHLNISCSVTKFDVISSEENQLWRDYDMGFVLRRVKDWHGRQERRLLWAWCPPRFWCSCLVKNSRFFIQRSTPPAPLGRPGEGGSGERESS